MCSGQGQLVVLGSGRYTDVVAEDAPVPVIDIYPLPDISIADRHWCFFFYSHIDIFGVCFASFLQIEELSLDFLSRFID